MCYETSHNYRLNKAYNTITYLKAKNDLLTLYNSDYVMLSDSMVP